MVEFCEMIWQEKIEIIVALCNEIESGRVKKSNF